jgi:integrase
VPQTEALRRYRRRRAEELLALGIRQDDESQVVVNGLGEPMAPNRLTEAFRAFAKEHGFDITFHGLRHTCAVLMLTTGTDVKTAAARLGHDPGLLLRTYAHFIRSADEAAAERLGRVLG